MKKSLKNSFILIAIAMFSLQSCKTNQLVSNGAYSDISLTRDASQYDIKRLKEIRTSGKAFFGIPMDRKVGNNFGTVVRFNGVELGGTKRIFPILTMITTSLIVGSATSAAFDMDLLPGTLIGLPISGAFNNWYWPEASTTRAFQKFNRKLVQDNKDIDVFLNPKYEISTKNGIWTSKTNLKGNVMGATIK
ncbi:hypothetical protein N8091_03360 [Flavobacteriaceae bacterium]|nr:hypothetical protein [Flavobacteriaceae bacterium]